MMLYCKYKNTKTNNDYILQQLKSMIKKYSRAIFLLGSLSEFGREVYESHPRLL